MGKLAAVFQRELTSLFVSPVAYVMGGCFLFLYGYFFYDTLASRTANLSPIMDNMTFAVFMLNPLISMKLLSEEKRSGTLELLLTSSLSFLTVILGKFAAAVALYGIILLLTLSGPIYLSFIAEVHWLSLGIQYLGLFLLGSAILGIGLAFSAATENQIVAGTLGVAASMGLFLLGWVAQSTTGLSHQILEEMTILTHYASFSRGVFDLRDAIYYILWIVLTLSIAHQWMESNLGRK